MLSQLINKHNYKDTAQKELTKNVTMLLNPYPIERGILTSKKKIDDSWEALRSGRV